MAGALVPKQNPLTADTPMRMPVKEPGPVTAQKKSQSETPRFA